MKLTKPKIAYALVSLCVNPHLDTQLTGLASRAWAPPQALAYPPNRKNAQHGVHASGHGHNVALELPDKS